MSKLIPEYVKPKKSLTRRYYDNEELTAEEREQVNAGTWRINAIQCRDCGETIQSTHRHDYKHCKCGKVYVDGGSWYLRRGGVGYIEKSVRYKSAEEK